MPDSGPLLLLLHENLVDYLAGDIVELVAREKRCDFTAHHAIVTPHDVLRCYKRESDKQ